MEQPAVIHSTFVIERHYTVTPARAFAAFADPAKKRIWFLEKGGNRIERFDMDFRPGGKEHARFLFKEGTPLAGVAFTNDTDYLNIVPDRRIVFSSAMTIGGKCISATLVTVEFLASETGTDLVLTHQGAFFEGADGPEMRESGWRKLLDWLQEELAAHAEKET